MLTDPLSGEVAGARREALLDEAAGAALVRAARCGRTHPPRRATGIRWRRRPCAPAAEL